MWKHVWLGLFITILSIGTARGQAFLFDQFRLEQPGLELSFFQDFSTATVCGDRTNPAGWFSFWCEARRNSPVEQGTGIDAAGQFYQLRGVVVETGEEPYCDGNQVLYQLERRTAIASELVLWIPGCVVLEEGREQVTEINNLVVDNVNGYIYMAATSILTGQQNTPVETGIIRISGLPTLLDIIPTFQPASETLSWITPKHPEALPSADRFMVYAGDIAALRQDRDFTRAVPVDCQVPNVGVPSPGEFLSILDPLQVEPGQVSYAIVGVEHQGKLRFGRQSRGGVLSGREPAVFPSCT